MLTPPQRDVLQLLAEGLSMKEIGDELNLATRTVAFHKYRTMETLDLHSSAELVQLPFGSTSFSWIRRSRATSGKA